MIGRNAAAMLSTSSVARVVHTSVPNTTLRLCIRAAPVAHRRFYATPGRPRRAVGESTTVKRAAPKKTASTTVRKDLAAARATAKKAKAAAEKAQKKVKAAADKAQKQAKAAALKQKTNERLKERQRKAKAKESAKIAAAKAKLKTKIAADKAKHNSNLTKPARLKEAALKPPQPGVRSAYAAFMSENKEAYRGKSLSEAQQVLKEVAARFKALSSSERAHYQQIAEEHKKAHQVALQQWVHAQPVEVIAAANRARHTLRKLFPAKAWPTIVDDRHVRPRSAWTQFIVETTSGKHVNVTDIMKEASTQWRTLSDTEKEAYKSRAAQHHTQYDSGYDTSSASPQQASASA